jgi:hypothetical protein
MKAFALRLAVALSSVIGGFARGAEWRQSPLALGATFAASVDIADWAREFSAELTPVSQRILVSRNLMSCSHVRYQLQQNEKLMLEALSAYQNFDFARFGSLWSLYQTGESLYKNSIAMRSSRFMTPIVEVTLARPDLTMPYLIKKTPFHFEYSSDEIPSEVIGRGVQSEKVIRLQLDYLDVCLGYGISVLQAPCFDFQDGACRKGAGGILKTTSIAQDWDSYFYGGRK